MGNDCVAQTWYRMLRTIGSPVALCSPQSISKTPQFMQWAVQQANGVEPAQQPCLVALPLIFVKAIRGVASQVDAFLGEFELDVVSVFFCLGHFHSVVVTVCS